MLDKHRFPLILPKDLFERIKTLARQNRRPITQEIIIAIEKHLADPGLPKEKEDAATN